MPRFVVNPPQPLMSEYAVDNHGIRTYISIAGGIVRVSDALAYADYVKCLDINTVVREVIDRGKPLEKALASRAMLRKVLGVRDLPRDEVGAIANEAVRVIRRFIEGYGVVEPLLLWQYAQDVSINESGVFMRTVFEDRYLPVDLRPSCDAGEMNLVDYVLNQVVERTRTPITSFSPKAMATDVEFGLRVTATVEPVSRGSVTFRVTRRGAWTVMELMRRNAISPSDALTILTAMAGVNGNQPIAALVFGPMGSGKTTAVEAFTNSLPIDLKVTFIQDVSEFNILPGRPFELLNTRDAYALGITPIGKPELISYALRTGANIISVNEILSPEDARAWLDAVTTGHGGATSIHAGGFDELGIRLRHMGINPEVLNSLILVHMVNKRVVDIRYPPTVRKVDVPGELSEELMSLGNTPEGVQSLWELIGSLLKT